VYGSVLASETVEVEIRPAGGEIQRVALTRVSAPIDAGFFVVNLGSIADAFPIHVSLYDNDGKTLGTKTIPPTPSP